MTDLAPRHLLRLTLAALVLHILLVQPNHPAAMTWEAPFLFALELPLILLALVLVSGPAATALRVFLTFALTLIAVLKTADFAMFTALARGFNPVADLVLIDAGLRLLAGSAGTIPAILTAIGAILATLTIAAAIWWASGIWAALSLGRRAWPVAGIGIIALAGLVTAEIGQAWGKWRLPVSPPVRPLPRGSGWNGSRLRRTR